MESRTKPRGGAKNFKRDTLNSEELEPLGGKPPFYEAEDEDTKDYWDFEDSKYGDWEND